MKPAGDFRSNPGLPRARAAIGFTLIELMVVLVIVATLLMVAGPGFRTLTERTRLKSYANEVVSSVYLARSEAIKRNNDMRLCVSSDGNSCTGGGSWEQGWLVIDPNDTVIKHQQPLAGGLVLFELSSSSFTNLVFESSGLAARAVDFKLCQQTPDEGVEEKIISVSTTGRARIQTTNTGCP